MANKYAKQSKEAKENAKKLRMCESKVAYDTIMEAKATGNDYYVCPYCNKYHTTGSFQALVNRLKK